MKIVLYILTVMMSAQVVLAETAVTNEWTCVDQKNRNTAVVPDETDPNKFEDWMIHTEAMNKPNYPLEGFSMTNIKKVNIRVPKVGRKQYVMMSYEYAASGVLNWGVFFCHRSN